MIAITDTAGYSALQFLENSTTLVIPNETEIQNLIGSSEFINTNITSAFKTLLKRISNETLNPATLEYLQPPALTTRVSQFFNYLGFYWNGGVIDYESNGATLDELTQTIIDEIHQLTAFQDIAYNAFHNNSWAEDANDIRALTNSSLQKLHYVTIFSLDTSDAVQLINDKTNILNKKHEDQRFSLISSAPEMPQVRIKNNSDDDIRLRLKIYFSKTQYANGTGVVYRKFLDYFPNEANAENPEDTIHTRTLDPQEFWDVNFDNRIRGGLAVIEFLPNPGNFNLWEDGDHHYFTFHIRGINPTRNNVLDYLNNSNYLEQYWFLLRMTKHESIVSTLDYNNSGENGNRRFPHFNYGTNYQNNNNQIGMPNFGGPRGFGLYQLDNFGRLTIQQINNLGLTNEFNSIQPEQNNEYQTIIDNSQRSIDNNRYIVSSDNEVWNWKENIDRAIILLNDKRIELNNVFTGWIQSINTWNNNNPNDLVTRPNSRQEGYIMFDNVNSTLTNVPNNVNDYFNNPNNDPDSVKCFFDASLIKYYNGASGGGHYLEMNIDSNGKPYWLFNPTRADGDNYVNLVCNTDEN